MEAMLRRRVAAPALLLGAALGLQGCVAGVIPLAAAGGLIGKRTILGDDENTDAAASADPGAASANAGAAAAPGPGATGATDLVAVDPGLAEPVAAGPVAFDPGPSEAASASPAVATGPLGAEAGRVGAPAALETVAAPETALAPETGATGRPEPESGSGIAINQLLSYAKQRQAAGAPSASAMLSDRISLKPERAPCNAITSTVLLDLDPEAGMFDSASAAQPLSGLGGGLARLRAEGVKIAWISASPLGQAGAIRTALARSGLDIREEDRLLLLRKPDDRKQKLREDLAKETCVIAIAGDTRSDFDELFEYLLNPGDAGSLEPLFGDGWFLIPQPLLSERPNS